MSLEIITPKLTNLLPTTHPLIGNFQHPFGHLPVPKKGPNPLANQHVSHNTYSSCISCQNPNAWWSEIPASFMVKFHFFTVKPQPYHYTSVREKTAIGFVDPFCQTLSVCHKHSPEFRPFCDGYPYWWGRTAWSPYISTTDKKLRTSQGAT